MHPTADCDFDFKADVGSKKIWATLITRGSYIPGVLTLNFSLIKHNSKYPLVALYTEQLLQEDLLELKKNNIKTFKINPLKPSKSCTMTNDPRFEDTWSKLYFFQLIQFERIVQLDSDMLVLQNMDELMDIPLLDYKFGSTHACVCNPKKFLHYPKNWNGENCVFSKHNYNLMQPISTLEYPIKEFRDYLGPSSHYSLAKCNSGILIVDPNLNSFKEIEKKLNDIEATDSYIFPDQDLLADVFFKNWLAISHNYNCLKTFKMQHEHLWDLNKIKNIHFILSPKPWEVSEDWIDESGTFNLWWQVNKERILSEKINS